jgi:aspartate ammonia-lyase
MPGKVNPVIPEVVNQVAYRVIGNDLTLTLASEAGQLQLNVMEPILALSLMDSLRILAAAVNTLTTRCIVGITANADHCHELVEGSIGIITAALPAIGYKKATEVARISLETKKPVREILREKGWLTDAQIDEILSPEAMTQPRR